VARYIRLLRRRGFALLWGGATISALGDGMSFVALVWLVLERSGDAGTVSWLAAVYTAPVIVGGLAAGIVLDRFDRRRVLVVDNLVRGVAVASIPVASLFGVLSTPQLFVVAAVYGLLFMTSLAGIPSLIPSLVEDDELTTANAMESVSYGLGGLAGPVFAGLVITLVGAPIVLAIDAATYLAFVACLLAMPAASAMPILATAPSPSSGSPVVTPTARSSGLRPAIRFVVESPAILTITLIYMAINVGEGMFRVLAPIYARDVLHGGAGTYGGLVSAFTGGSFVGALLVGGMVWRSPLGRSIAAATTLTGLAMGLLLVRPPLEGALLILALAGLFASSLTAWAQTIRMRLIPPELRGRVFALLRTFMQSTPPLGALLGGMFLASGELTLMIATMAGIIAIPGAMGLVLPALGRAATGEAVAPATPALEAE
jgi:MFS family permease